MFRIVDEAECKRYRLDCSSALKKVCLMLDSVYTRRRNCDRIEASKKTGEEKMDATYHRHDISDQVWSLLEPH